MQIMRNSGVSFTSTPAENPLRVAAMVAEGISYLRDITKTVARMAVATAVLAAGGAFVGHKFEQQEKINAELAQEQALSAEELAEMRARLQRLGGVVTDINDTEVPKGVLTGESLSPVEALPAFGWMVGPELSEKAKKATVKIGRQDKDTNNTSFWSQNCTATKVTYKDRTFIFSASHCFKDGLDDPSKDTPMQGGPDTIKPIPKAVNITAQSNARYAILDPAIPSDKRHNSEPLAFVTNLAIDRSETADWALMEVTANPASHRSFDEIPSLKLADESELTPPTPGQQAAVHSMPASSANTLISSPGIYVGRVRSVGLGNASSSYDVVGVQPSDTPQDTCNYGASGSHATLADGRTTGPLAWRNNIGYPGDTREPVDGEASTTRRLRLTTEERTGLNLDRFSTLCYYSVGEPSETLPNLISVLDDPNLVLYAESGKMK